MKHFVSLFIYHQHKTTSERQLKATENI